MTNKTNHYNLSKYKQIDLDSLLHTYNNDRDYAITVNKRDIKIKDATRHDVLKGSV